MNKLGSVGIGNSNPVRIMGILNTSPESFYKKSIKTTKKKIRDTIRMMESDGADFIDVGGMSTAPYLSTIISEKLEAKRITNAIKLIQNSSNLPISVDTCRSYVAQRAFEEGAEILNDVTGLKYDSKILKTIEKYDPSVILCAYSNKPVLGNQIVITKKLLKQSISLAITSNISTKQIVLDPAIGFFRKTGQGPFFTKIKSDWVHRDLLILQNLKLIKQGYPILISVSNKSFIGKILNIPNPADRLSGSLASEVFSVINGADIIRTHNVKETKEVITITQRLIRTNKSL
ncbi:MAG: dihydropteroate synthase [Nitrosopumilaceae archaeon]